MIGKKNVDEWVELIKKRDEGLISRLKTIYGTNKKQLDERMSALLCVALKFKDVFGSQEVSFSRAPGRLNTLSMHSDHRGSYINPISLNREILFCFAGRDDDVIEVHNVNPNYESRCFSIGEESPGFPITNESEWLDWTQKKTDERKAAGTNDDWVNKLKSVPVYLVTRFPDKKLKGYNAVLDSTIPGAAGLSSSSALVVAGMDMMTYINDITLDDKTFVRYVGIGEWYVGTRGGFGDQAAIKNGRLGKIIHMTTLPELKIDSYLPFPEGYKIVIFNSWVVADKTGAAAHKFNEKTATYEIGEMYIRNYMKKHHADRYNQIVEDRQELEIQKKFHLADIVECLNQQEIYDLIESIPERMSRQDLLNDLPGEEVALKKQFATHDEPAEAYPVRLVITYGIGECRRGRMLKEVLSKGQVDVYGRLMCISHDGDRVVLDTPRFDPSKELHEQPGDYGCSVPEIDEMVDIAMEAGAVGAQISGAGMGGSMMALVNEDDVDAVVLAMREKYYVPHGFEEKVIVAQAVQGAGVL